MLFLDLPIDIFDRIITEYVTDVGIAEAWAARATCKTFNNLIHNKMVENMPMTAFTTSRHEDRQMIGSFLRVHLDLLLGRRSTAQNDFHWVLHLLVDAVIAIMQYEDCSSQDPLGHIYMTALNEYLGTVAKGWTIARLLDGAQRDFDRDYPLGVMCAAVVIDSLDAVKECMKERDTFVEFFQCTSSMQHEYIGAGRWAFSQPFLAAVATGKTRILRYFLARETWSGINGFGWFNIRSIFQALRLAVVQKQIEALLVLHDHIVEYKHTGLEEGQYKDLLLRAADAGNITMFRTVLHLTVQHSSHRTEHGVFLSKDCDEAHEDMIWILLLSAILELEDETCISGDEKRKIVQLVSFIVAYYTPLLEKSFLPTAMSLQEAVAAGNLRQVKLLLQRGNTLSNEDLWKADRELHRMGYNAYLFEQCRNGHTNTSNGRNLSKKNLITLYVGYKASGAHFGRRKTKLQQLVRHVEKDGQMAKGLREWIKGLRDNQVRTDMEFLQKAKMMAEEQPVVVVPEDVGDGAVLACGASVLVKE